MRQVAALAVASFLVSGAASARPTADDLSAIVFLSQGVGVAEVQGPTFQVVVEVEGSTGVPRPVTIRTTFPTGLSFANPPAAADGCNGETTVVCTKPMAVDGAGTARATWRWDMRAAAAGSYTLTVTASSEEPDPNGQNNAGTLQFRVTSASPPPPPPPPPASVRAGAARVLPTKPRAGGLVRASVAVSAAGSAIRPTAVACKATVAGQQLRGTSSKTSGAASCSFKTPAAAKGKLVRGSVRLTARGQSFVRSFSIRLR
jgi:Domain of unknown function DUF11